jgi:hypothetical protein
MPEPTVPLLIFTDAVNALEMNWKSWSLAIHFFMNFSMETNHIVTLNQNFTTPLLFTGLSEPTRLTK